MDLTLIPSTISGLKLASDLAKGFLDLKSMTDVQSKVIELQSAILSAQSTAMAANAEQASLLDEMKALRSELEAVKAWGEQRLRYTLVAPWSGALTYALHKERSYGEPPHWICTKCYEDGKKSILNPDKGDGWYKLVCPRCEASLQSPWRSAPEPTYAE